MYMVFLTAMITKIQSTKGEDYEFWDWKNVKTVNQLVAYTHIHVHTEYMYKRKTLLVLIYAKDVLLASLQTRNIIISTE